LITVDEFADRNVAVLGLGRTGLAAARSLIAGGAHVQAWDDNEAQRNLAAYEGIPIVDLSRRDLADLAALILSPGIPHTLPRPHHIVSLVQACDVPILSDIELYARKLARMPKDTRPKVIGITGTNGKSTTTALITHILKSNRLDARSAGNIGRAVLDLPAPRMGQIHVIELSSYQLELTSSLACDVAVLLNLSPDHLDRHGDMEIYQKIKTVIFSNQHSEQLAIIGMDDERCARVMANMVDTQHQVVGISASQMLSQGVYAVGGKLYDSSNRYPKMLADLSQAPGLQGPHNWQNAAAAYAACRHLGVSSQKIRLAFETFRGLPHRTENLGMIDNIRCVNDSKATNGEATAQALSSYDNIYWIAGGIAKKDGLLPTFPFMKSIRKAYLFGQDGAGFAKELHNRCDTDTYLTMDQAFASALMDAQKSSDPEPVILLSPACASFDQFTDFEARGDAFRKLCDAARRLSHDRGAA